MRTSLELAHRARTRAAAWQVANPEKARARKAAWQKANQEKHRLSSAQYRNKNREKCVAATARWYGENRSHANEMSLAWLQEHPEKRVSYGARHRAAKLLATTMWANSFLIEEAYALAQLRTQTTGFKWHVDHVVPLQSPLVCGLHVESNLQVIPSFKNQSKGNRHWPDMP